MPGKRGGSISLLWRDDEELAKKDDDLGLPGHSKTGARWQSTARSPRRRVILRMAGYAFLLFLAVVIIRSVVNASTTSSSSSMRSSYAGREDFGINQPPPPPPLDTKPQGPPLQPLRPAPNQDKPPPPPVQDTTSKPKSDEASGGAVQGPPRTYNGKLKFPELGNSLQAIAPTGGNKAKNRNVLFAAANLQSAATLLPLACDMATEKQNYVHFAFTGRSDIKLQDLLSINGIDSECPLIMHDARPDMQAQSTDYRMTIAVARALYHINLYMHPQVIFVDSTSTEESFFLSGVRDELRRTAIELIELPDSPNSRFSWLTKLDTTALVAWNKVHFDIIVHAPTHGTGNLARLLRSLSQSDIGAVGFPHLTIELPSVMDENLQRLVSGFRWPPSPPVPGVWPNMLTLRHRIPRQKLTEETSAAKFLESFWPSDPNNHHVLILSPNAEITPQFFSYVKYSILHHLYSDLASFPAWKMLTMGISFSAPTTLLDGSYPLEVPSTDTASDNSAAKLSPPFLWQGPSSDAMLIAGTKWVELHGYASNILERQSSWSTTPELLSKKVSKMYPSWLEYLLQLSRLRGYFTVYPGRETASLIVGVHTDLQDKPEEYADEQSGESSATNGAVSEGGLHGVFDPKTQVDVMVTLPDSGRLPSSQDLPILGWDGKQIGVEKLVADTLDYSQRFRTEIGRCPPSDDPTPLQDSYAKDLFCDTTTAES